MMDPIQVAFLTLGAVVVGMLIPVMLQAWLTLREVRRDLQQVHAKLDPMLDEVRSVVSQVRNATLIASAAGVAVTAGIRAWREATSHEMDGTPTQETVP